MNNRKRPNLLFLLTFMSEEIHEMIADIQSTRDGSGRCNLATRAMQHYRRAKKDDSVVRKPKKIAHEPFS